MSCLECGDPLVDTEVPGLWWCETCDAGRDARGARVCGCGCGASLVGRIARTKFAGDSHRQRRYRRRVAAAARAAGVPATLSLQTVRAPDPTNDRNGDAPAARQRPKRPPRPGVSVYLPTLELAERVRAEVAVIVDAGAPELEPAEDALDRAISRRRARA